MKKLICAFALFAVPAWAGTGEVDTIRTCIGEGVTVLQQAINGRDAIDRVDRILVIEGSRDDDADSYISCAISSTPDELAYECEGEGLARDIVLSIDTVSNRAILETKFGPFKNTRDLVCE